MDGKCPFVDLKINCSNKVITDTWIVTEKNKIEKEIEMLSVLLKIA